MSEDIPDWKKKFVPDIRWEAPKASVKVEEKQLSPLSSIVGAKPQRTLPRFSSGNTFERSENTFERIERLRRQAQAATSSSSQSTPSAPQQKILPRYGQAATSSRGQSVSDAPPEKILPRRLVTASAQDAECAERAIGLKADARVVHPEERKSLASGKITPGSSKTSPAEKQEVIQERKRPISIGKQGKTPPRPPSQPPPQHLQAPDSVETQPTAVKSVMAKAKEHLPKHLPVPKKAAQPARRSLPQSARSSGSSVAGALPIGVISKPGTAPGRISSTSVDAVSSDGQNRSQLPAAVAKAPPAAKKKKDVPLQTPPWSKSAKEPVTAPPSSDAENRRNTPLSDSEKNVLQDVEDRLWNSKLSDLHKSNIMSFKSCHNLDDTTELALKLLCPSSLQKVLGVQVRREKPPGVDANKFVRGLIMQTDQDIVRLVEEIERIDRVANGVATSYNEELAIGQAPHSRTSPKGAVARSAPEADHGSRKRIRLPAGNSVSSSTTDSSFAKVAGRNKSAAEERATLAVDAAAARIRSRSVPFSRARSALASQTSSRAEHEVRDSKHRSRSRDKLRNSNTRSLPVAPQKSVTGHVITKAAAASPQHVISKSAAAQHVISKSAFAPPAPPQKPPTATKSAQPQQRGHTISKATQVQKNNEGVNTLLEASARMPRLSGGNAVVISQQDQPKAVVDPKVPKLSGGNAVSISQQDQPKTVVDPKVPKLSGGNAVSISQQATAEEEFEKLITESIRAADNKRTLEQYIPAICREFSSVAQLKAVVNEENPAKGVLNCIEPALWEALEVRTLGHKLLLAKAIINTVS